MSSRTYQIPSERKRNDYRNNGLQPTRLFQREVKPNSTAIKIDDSGDQQRKNFSPLRYFKDPDQRSFSHKRGQPIEAEDHSLQQEQPNSKEQLSKIDHTNKQTRAVIQLHISRVIEQVQRQDIKIAQQQKEITRLGERADQLSHRLYHRSRIRGQSFERQAIQAQQQQAERNLIIKENQELSRLIELMLFRLAQLQGNSLGNGQYSAGELKTSNIQSKLRSLRIKSIDKKAMSRLATSQLNPQSRIICKE